LKVRFPLPFRVLDSHARLLLGEGHLLADEAQFESLVERGAWAERSLVEAARTALAKTVRASLAPVPSLFDRWEKLLWELDKLTRALIRRQVSGDAVHPFCASMQQLVTAEPDVALFLSVRQEDRRFALYPLTHALHCAVVAVLTARHLGWPETRIVSLGCSALTMNLTILELQALMAEAEDPPSAKQLKEIRAHPESCVQLLRAIGIDDEDWLKTVVEHHEHDGGGGYPANLVEVSDAAQVLRASDVFMAKISPRAKRPPMPAQVAVRQLFQQQPGSSLAMAMIKTLGVHPPGSLVQLRSGEVAVVIRRPARGTHPVVATLSDNQGRPSVKTHVRDCAVPEFGVAGPLADTRLFSRVLPERVYGVMPFSS
jgi:HD-GYP domain-containing protein (c-di-GMP phosphodiesterase class II)